MGGFRFTHDFQVLHGLRLWGLGLGQWVFGIRQGRSGRADPAGDNLGLASATRKTAQGRVLRTRLSLTRATGKQRPI
ncbi:hypothetical protein PROH_09405 [Prochlorothrix hollandica PCC 9006 = CALU 1027]|uniref:Uncharacterized protein n=1 Tax=Prochlorothrix hollandica PCC 9006 = CALU 1027 TaxID=317619 RepID=A0A0M2PZ69_PROHO|nr:hypothetical protein PROH_09405 [Prochlorothrix hollandica PCC 9006 = CALU 1027]